LIFIALSKHLLLIIRKANGPNQIIGHACKFGISKSSYYISPTLYPILCILVMSFLIWKSKQLFKLMTHKTSRSRYNFSLNGATYFMTFWGQGPHMIISSPIDQKPWIQLILQTTSNVSKTYILR
jgi:hypothetical protein